MVVGAETGCVRVVGRVPGGGCAPKRRSPGCPKIRCLISERERAPDLWTAGRVRGPVVGSSPGRQSRAMSKIGKEKESVTPFTTPTRRFVQEVAHLLSTLEFPTLLP